MNEARILESLFYTLPALVTGLLAYYFFHSYTKNQYDKKQRISNQETQKEIWALRIQAYERMVLFLERIYLPQLLTRVVPQSSDNNAYEVLLIEQIETEYQHNITQQLYISDACWTIIKTSKNATIQLIRKLNMNEKTTTANTLRTVILNHILDQPSPCDVALHYIKKEVRTFW